ncbi:MAG TPA: hypothetical protein DEQ40_00380 [Oxalobacteraceae bacterium]|jgi:hypothetical protein|nr:hypothetical protein [Oxalobacteraceae bacterium]
METFEETRGTWLDDARAAAKHLAATNGTVTIDDVRAVCPPPDDIDPRVMGAVLRTGKDFSLVGYQASDRPESTGRPICIFKLAGNVV